MRSNAFVALACVISAASVWACSDDGEGEGAAGNQMIGPLQGQGGGGGNGGSAANNGGSSQAGGGGVAGTSAGASGEGGSAGDGMAGGTMAAGAGGGEPDAGPPEPGEPDAGDQEPPVEADVTFADVFPILTARCGGCHGNPNGGLPAFAQANEDAAYDVTQTTGQMGMDLSQRIVVRAVQLRTMPPQCNGAALGTPACLTVDQADQLQEWFDQGAEP